MTICRKENGSVGSGTDGGNSDIGVLADFSADEEESQVEQTSGCRIPGCQCKGRIESVKIPMRGKRACMWSVIILI